MLREIATHSRTISLKAAFNSLQNYDFLLYFVLSSRTTKPAPLVVA